MNVYCDYTFINHFLDEINTINDFTKEMKEYQINYCSKEKLLKSSILKSKISNEGYNFILEYNNELKKITIDDNDFWEKWNNELCEIMDK